VILREGVATMQGRLLSAGLVTAVIAACGGPAALDAGVDGGEGRERDGGARPDAGGTLDGGFIDDAGVTLDAGTRADAGPDLDAGSPDAGSSFDGGPFDAGSVVDAGSNPDAGTAFDGGPLDAGTPRDAGLVFDGGANIDAGALSDAGQADAGLSCAAPGPWAPHLVVTLLDGGALPSALNTRDRLDVRVVDLPPCRDVELEFRLDGGFVTRATFRSGVQGLVSTATDAPVSGAWTGVKPDALFFTSSNGGLSSPTSHTLFITGRYDGGAPITTLIPREVLPPGTTVSTFRETTATGLYADFYRPPGVGPFPTVVVFGGSEGGLGGGALTGSGLVRDGFAVLAIAYWNVPGKPGGMNRIPLETFQRAVQRVRTLPDVRTQKIAVLGVSRGGEAALLAGASFPTDIQAVVSYVGSSFAWAAPGSSTAPTWTLDGGDVPFLPWPTGGNTTFTRDSGITASSGEPFFRRGYESAADAGFLPLVITRVERIAGPVLILGSGDDQVWPSCLLSAPAFARLADAGHVTTWGDEYRCFPGAGHSINLSRIGFPLADLIDRGTSNPRSAYGGTAEVDDATNRLMGPLVTDFLTRALQ
jgi:alpha-beta hydrolase superfamily lysophospholipase